MDHVYTFYAHYLDRCSAGQIRASTIREAIGEWLRTPAYVEPFQLTPEKLVILQRDLGKATIAPNTPFLGWWFVWSGLGQDFRRPAKGPRPRGVFRIEIFDTRYDSDPRQLV
jgi:hypothetical protein